MNHNKYLRKISQESEGPRRPIKELCIYIELEEQGFVILAESKNEEYFDAMITPLGISVLQNPKYRLKRFLLSTSDIIKAIIFRKIS